jgi:hypothetical protein
LQSTYGSQENDTALVPDNVCSLIIINVHRRLSKSRQFNSSSLDFLFIYICVMAKLRNTQTYCSVLKII